jgi:hypothetical protein
MADRDKRMNPSDVFNASTPILGNTTDQARAFPSVGGATIDVVSRFSPSGKEHEYSTRSELREFIDCTNRRCYNGGFALGLMEIQGQAEGTFTEPCQGYEGSPKGRVNDGPCDNIFTVKVSLRFKETERVQ